MSDRSAQLLDAIERGNLWRMKELLYPGPERVRHYPDEPATDQPTVDVDAINRGQRELARAGSIYDRNTGIKTQGEI
jgi:hypothetical protein